MSENNEIKRTAIDDEYATGIAPLCCYCGAKVPKSEVVWGSTAGAWHPRCSPVIRFENGVALVEGSIIKAVIK